MSHPFDPETEPESCEPLRESGPSAAPVLGLAVIFTRDDPSHVGAWLPVPASGARLLGRGERRDDDPAPRLLSFRQRPGRDEPLGSFQSAAISRAQCSVERVAGDLLRVVNLGRRRLVINGQAVEEGTLAPGDVLEVGSQLLLVCASRAPSLRELDAAMPEWGRADAHGLVGESPAMWSLRREIAFAASKNGHVLLLGASGTGKELVARALHAASSRRGSLVARNAATLPEALVDAELFGNLRGYPNPGMQERKGLIGAADAGTLFLDEFADLPPNAQAHLLRVLDQGEYQRLGESQTRQSNFRLIAATNRPESTLRDDLRARFDFTLRLPSLEDRREDLGFLVRHLLEHITANDPTLQARAFGGADAGPSFDFMARLARYDFVGNVRELRQRLWAALASETGWESAFERATEDGEMHAAEDEAVKIQAALDQHNGSIERTWRALGLSSRHALARLVKKHALAVTKRPS